MKNVIVIDDSEVNLVLIKSIFDNRPDIKVKLIEDSREAKQNIISLNPDLIILDIMMPEIDGFDILEFLKSDEKFKLIPVIILSARDDKETKEKVFNYGIKDYFTKPVILKEIEKKVNAILDTKSI